MSKVYTYKEVHEASLKYFNGDDLAAQVFAGKYALKDDKGNTLELTPSDMHRRLAKEFARIENKYPNPLSKDEIYDLLASWEIVPQGSPMSAIGNPYQMQSLSNCFVIDPPHDSYGGIMKADQEQAQIMKRRGGVGIDVSSIRPKGLVTANAARTTDGIAVFMDRFSNTCREVAQGGRRGALMLTISCSHPEIETFINIKRDLKKVTGANISIRLSDAFMNAVKNDTDFTLQWPVDVPVENAKVTKQVKAREIWDQIVEAAWASAEPGLLFWDTILRKSPADAYSSLGFKTLSTNPCAELPLSAGDSCRLLLVNLVKFVDNPFEKNARFDYERFSSVVKKAQKLMDDLVDLEIEVIDKIINKIESDPEPEHVKRTELELWKRIRQSASSGRRTGLGITALGDAIAALGVRYGSDQSVSLTEELYKTLCLSAYKSSVEMARDRGPFPVFSHSLERGQEFIEHVMSADAELRSAYEKHGRRNIALLTTAPAGSVSILTQTTSGCEPAYLLSYKRRRKINPNDLEAKVDFIDDLGDKWQEYTVYHHGFKKWMDVTGLDDPEQSPYWKSTSNDIDWVKKIDVQAAAQRWIDHAISNTTNVPHDTSIDTVKNVYMHGWETGCKGVTIYRDGSRTGVLVSETKPEQKALDEDDRPQEIVESHAPKRPQELQCDIHKVNVKGDNYTVLVGLLDNRPYEIFAGLSEHVEVPKKAKRGVLIKNGKKDGISTYNLRIPLGDDDELMFKDIVNIFDNPLYGSFTRTISLALRHGVSVKHLVEQLRKDKNSDMTSFSSCVARVLSKHYIPDGTKASSEKTCPDCGGVNLQYVQGCVTCGDCGNSKCG